jgi:hypothetical protein
VTDTHDSDLDRPLSVVRGPDALSLASGGIGGRGVVGGIERRLTSQLVDALEDSPVISSPDNRELLREALEASLGPLGLRDHARARSVFVDIIQACRKRRSGLAEFAASVELIAGRDPACHEVYRLIEQLQALSIESTLAQMWQPLSDALAAVPLSEVQSIILYVTDGRIGVLPTYCDKTWPAFIHLVGANSSPGNPVPPWVTFLELVRYRFSDDAGDLVRLLTRRLATTWGCTAELDRAGAQYDAEPARPTKAGVLTVVLSPDPTDPGSFTLYTVHRWEDDVAAPVRDEDVTVRRDGLLNAVETAVARAEEDWAARSADLKIEFVLPLSLLNEPVEWWPKESSEGSLPAALAVYHSVVVRSLERLRRPSWHRRWLCRWDRLQAGSDSKILQGQDPGRPGHLRRLEAELADGSYVGVVLSRPPSPDITEPQEIIVALRAGVPLIVWHRGGDSTPEVRKTIARLLKDLRTVPEAATQLRREIERQQDGDSDSGRELSVLWDDAHRAPSLPLAGREASSRESRSGAC